MRIIDPMAGIKVWASFDGKRTTYRFSVNGDTYAHCARVGRLSGPRSKWWAEVDYTDLNNKEQTDRANGFTTRREAIFWAAWQIEGWKFEEYGYRA